MIEGNEGTTLLDAARLWPTPDAFASNDGEGAESWRERQAKGKAEYASRGPGEVKAGNGASPPLSIIAKEWATPTSSESANRTTREVPSVSDGRGRGQHLSAQAIEGAAWSTPTTQDAENNGPPSQHRRTPPLNAQATAPTSGPPDLTTPKDGERTSSDIRVLNPRFVEALMGFPTGWTDFARSETQWCRRRRTELSRFLLSATASMPSPGRSDVPCR